MRTQEFPYHLIKTLKGEFYRINSLQKNKNVIKRVGAWRYKTGKPANRYWTFEFIDVISKIIDLNNINIIFDVGSRDGLQSLEFNSWFPEATVFAFEPEPNAFERVKKKAGPNLICENLACSDANGIISFYSVPEQINLGASSILKNNPSNPRSAEWAGTEISVEAIRIEKYLAQKNLEKVDLLWMDVQGYEMQVLRGIGNHIKNIKAIATEIGVADLYEGGTTLRSLHEFMVENDFLCAAAFCHDKIPEISFIEIGSGEMDLVYVNKKFIIQA